MKLPTLATASILLTVAAAQQTEQQFDKIDAEYCLAEGGTNRVGGEAVSLPDVAQHYRGVLSADPAVRRAADDWLYANEPRHSSMLRTSVSPNVISGGYRSNVIPSEARATLDVRMDMSFTRAKGIQCFGIGPAIDIEDGPRGFGAHSDQERILESELHRFVRLNWDIVSSLARANSVTVP